MKTLLAFRSRRSRPRSESEIQAAVAPPTWGRFEATCILLKLYPDDVLTGKQSYKEARVETRAERIRVLDTILTNGEDLDRLKDDQLEAVLAVALIEFFGLASQAVKWASKRADLYAARTGVNRLGEMKGSGTSLTGVLVEMPISDYVCLTQKMDLEDMLFFLTVRGVYHVAKNVKDYLG